jgi:hypothetical protein
VAVEPRSDEWTVGDRVYVPRITEDLTVQLKIDDFCGDEDEEDPDVRLMMTEFDSKGKITRQMFRYCVFSELQDTPRKATRGGAIARMKRGLEDVYCRCGCGQLTSGAEFKQGHDAKLKSRLLKTARGQIEGDADEAVRLLKERGWEKFL